MGEESFSWSVSAWVEGDATDRLLFWAEWIHRGLSAEAVLHQPGAAALGAGVPAVHPPWPQCPSHCLSSCPHGKEEGKTLQVPVGSAVSQITLNQSCSLGCQSNLSEETLADATNHLLLVPGASR